MGGFGQRDALAVVTEPQIVDACSIRSGRLVIEVESAVVREYPNLSAGKIHGKQQPMLLISLTGNLPGETEHFTLVAPAAYQSGDRIGFFSGRRILEVPIRRARQRQLTLRLAENVRTVAPSWVKYGGMAAAGISGAIGATGAPVPSASALAQILDVLRQLDLDDLILIWSQKVDTLLEALGAPAEKRALRYHLDTTRRVPMGPEQGKPSAELALVLYIEPEPCL
jgi:hypothetical protein